MQRRGILADPLAAAATALLLLVVAGRVAVSAWLPAPARAERLRPAEEAAAPRGRLLLLVDQEGTPHAREAAARARRNWPDLPLEARTLRPEDRELRSLVHAYGYTRLPVLLTVDRLGHVVRIAPQ
jgi:hypothetical protein